MQANPPAMNTRARAPNLNPQDLGGIPVPPPLPGPGPLPGRRLRPIPLPPINNQMVLPQLRHIPPPAPPPLVIGAQAVLPLPALLPAPANPPVHAPAPLLVPDAQIPAAGPPPAAVVQLPHAGHALPINVQVIQPRQERRPKIENFEKFSGASSEDVDQWIVSIHASAKAYGFQTHQLLDILPALLKGSSINWYARNKARLAAVNFDEFLFALKAEFSGKAAKAAADAKFKARKQQPGETVRDFYREISESGNKAGRSDESIREVFVDGLLINLRTMLLSSIAKDHDHYSELSLSELVNISEKIEISMLPYIASQAVQPSSAAPAKPIIKVAAVQEEESRLESTLSRFVAALQSATPTTPPYRYPPRWQRQPNNASQRDNSTQKKDRPFYKNGAPSGPRRYQFYPE
ncbi:MAG: hypothetical protein WBW31_05725, partial [Candidatus Sulfotelmatobacter sp.]